MNQRDEDNLERVYIYETALFDCSKCNREVKLNLPAYSYHGEVVECPYCSEIFLGETE